MQTKTPGQNESRFLARRILFSLAIIAGIIIVTQILLQWSNAQQSDDSRIINIAGRQRMLSQRLSKAMLVVVNPSDEAERQDRLEEFRAALNLWTQSHQGLQHGDKALDLSGKNSAEVNALFVEIEPSYQAIVFAAECFIALETGGTPDSTCPTDSTALLAQVLTHEKTFLSGMDEIVAQYDDEASNRVSQTLLFDFVLLNLVLVVLAGVWYWVLRPTVRTVGETIAANLETLQQNETLLESVQVQTRNLQTVADVNAQISTILEMGRLLQDVVDLTKERFGLYHAHIYMVNDAGDTLVLTAGAGHVGRQMVAEYRTIALDNPQSIVARAANERQRQGIIVNDVTASPTFLPHPLLPDTKSELAVPLVARGQLLGVLDVQSNQVNYFTAEVLGVMRLMAGQIATALSNARLFEIADRIGRHERALSQIDAKIQSAVDIDDLLQTVTRELGKALRVPHTAVELQIMTGNETVRE